MVSCGLMMEQDGSLLVGVAVAMPFTIVNFMAGIMQELVEIKNIPVLMSPVGAEDWGLAFRAAKEHLALCQLDLETELLKSKYIG